MCFLSDSDDVIVDKMITADSVVDMKRLYKEGGPTRRCVGFGCCRRKSERSHLLE